MTELLLGAGNSRTKKLYLNGESEWKNLVTLDIDTDSDPDVVHNLDRIPWPFENNTFAEVHAYEVLEHLGQQGNFRSFFDTFYEVWRILRPNGFLYATVPMWNSMWAWGDPGHTRVINLGSLVFLNQKAYQDQVGKTAMTDYRNYWKGNFEIVWYQEKGESFSFILKAIK